MTVRGRFRRLSLLRRLVLGMLVLVAIGLAASSVLTYYLLQSVMAKRVATGVTATAGGAAATMNALAAGSRRPTDDQIHSQLAPLLSDNEVLVWWPKDGTPVTVTNLRPAPPVDGAVIVHLEQNIAAARNGYPQTYQYVVNSVDHVDYQVSQLTTPTGYLAVAASLSDLDGTMSALLNIEAIVGLVLLVLLAALGVFVVRRGLRPLDRIVVTAEAISRGDRGQRIPLAPGHTEVGRVSAALNRMLDKTEASFAAQRESEERLRRFIADASHELRTPLASVRSYAELLRTGAAHTPGDRQLATERIESESARMSELVEDLLLLARLDAGRPLRADPVELSELVRDAVADEDAIDPGRSRTVTVTGDTRVRGDANRLRQVLANLLANTRVHTPPGTPVEIELTGPENGDGWVRLVVTDHGGGLSDVQARQVFERFYRVDTARARRAGGGTGVGLGLAIVAAIVGAHHGTVHAGRAPKRGARFSVNLPAAGSTS